MFKGEVIMNKISFSQIKKIVDNIPKEEHHLFYHGNEFKNSPYSVYRNAIFSSSNKNSGAFIEIYNLDKSNPNIGIVVIAATPDIRGKGYTDKLIKDAISAMPSIGIDRLYWRCSNDNDHSYQLALRNGFKLEKRSSSKERLLTYSIESTILEYARTYDKPMYYYLDVNDLHDKKYPVGKCIFPTIDAAVKEVVWESTNKRSNIELPIRMYLHMLKAGTYELRISYEVFGAYWSIDDITLICVGAIIIKENGQWTWDTSNLIKESGIEPLLYHGSPVKFSTLKVRDSGYSGKHAFATDNYAFALAYAGKQWSDFEINQSQVNGVMYLTEIIPGKLKEIFDRPGYIHCVPSEDFKPFHGVEYISDKDSKVAKTITIPNILDELRKNPNVKLFEYPNLPFFIPNREKYLRELSKKYGNHDVVKIMNIIKSKE